MHRLGANSTRAQTTPLEPFPTFGVYVEVTAPPTWSESQVRRVLTRLLRVDGWPLELVAVTTNRDPVDSDPVPERRGADTDAAAGVASGDL